ncbi:AaceriACR198Wp [[Ashbya] aceris (nom. inval.)]|nr:AaceriACR198Wp [[Ashbya] aceris (nom. inval.)]
MSSFDINQERAVIQDAADFLNGEITAHFGAMCDFKPRVLIICGSGLGGISHVISSTPEPLSVPYSAIPGFKASTIVGHAGDLLFGFMNKTPVVLMKGRLHGYEGNTAQEITRPIRILNELGSIGVLIVTNASGAVNPEFNACELMCINDHISFPGLCGFHPLRGPNFDETGPRFLATSDAYDLELRQLLFSKHKELGIARRLHEGVYAHVSGPTFESRAESRLIRLVGADSVGMSTVPEVVVARHCGWRVLALSLITNCVVLSPAASALDANPVPMALGKAEHSEVIVNAAAASTDVEMLVEAVVGAL